METYNQSLVTEIILLGFSLDLRINIALFVLFFVIYLITCFGNVLIFCIIIYNPYLHKPMYFFLCNLSILDLGCATNVLPKLLADLFSAKRVISLTACAVQLYSSLYLGGVECLVLALMAYDRYVAICCPLHYTVLMSWNVCNRLTIFIWIFSLIISVVPSFLMPISLCNPNQINHFMCEVLAILKLACGNVFKNQLTIFSLSFLSILLPFILILSSYICIISSILKVNTIGRGKAFSTCTSHLIVVGLFFGTAMMMYTGPSSNYSSDQEKYISMVYLILTPMVNPIIYSLKNTEIRNTCWKIVENLK